ncbi:hypothetical protein ALQ95_102404 [Pseudomonas syringae pv. ribicola]|uniref:Uncharacterized protein n=1 Tax=Pseudomonas syringae pv. ribicola TaxID=55398 RepID=A0A3M2VHW8_PSESI|nr:hypothetical protein ALQ95_102404 [Pseudomonas syringae pv. ribicola]
MFASSPRPLHRGKGDVQAIVSWIQQKRLPFAGTVSLVITDVRIGPEDAAQMAIGG